MRTNRGLASRRGREVVAFDLACETDLLLAFSCSLCPVGNGTVFINRPSHLRASIGDKKIGRVCGLCFHLYLSSRFQDLALIERYTHQWHHARAGLADVSI